MFSDAKQDSSDMIEADLIFHLKVVAASQNNTLRSLFIKIIPDLLALLQKTKALEGKQFFKAVYEHDSIIGHIDQQDTLAAATVMELHLK